MLAIGATNRKAGDESITDSGNAAYEKALSEWLHAKKIITMLLQGGKDE